MEVLLVVYDNDAYMHTFPQGTAYIASALREAGHNVTIYDQAFNHYKDDYLTEYLDNRNFDVIGMGVIGGYYQYRKLLSISKAISRSINRPKYYILGGHGPSPDPEFFLKKTGADFVVIGEGEITIVELLDALSKGKSLEQIHGIAYLNGNRAIVTPKRELIQDVDSIPLPAYDMFKIKYYRLYREVSEHTSNSDFVMPVLSGRGCKFNCNFCYRMDKGFRPRTPETIIEEIEYLKKNYAINFIIFSDDLFMSSKHRTIELCEAFLKSKLAIKWWCNGRLNYATPEVLKLMKKAGCVYINYGIESYDDDMLKVMNKGLTTKQIKRGVEATSASGISQGLNIIFGNIGETKEILEKGVKFLLKYDDCSKLRTIRPVTPYPGSPLYYYAIEKGLLKNNEDFYENKHINSDLITVNFTDLTDDEYYEALMQANMKLVDNYYNKKREDMINITKKLYMNRDAWFRGYRHT